MKRWLMDLRIKQLERSIQNYKDWLKKPGLSVFKIKKLNEWIKHDKALLVYLKKERKLLEEKP
jgi:hypothetical protein